MWVVSFYMEGMVMGFVLVGDSCRGEDRVLRDFCIGIFEFVNLGVWN